MVYRVKVDGEERYIEKHFTEYSLEKDNQMKKEIIQYFLDVENAQEVLIEVSEEQARKGSYQIWEHI